MTGHRMSPLLWIDLTGRRRRRQIRFVAAITSRYQVS